MKKKTILILKLSRWFLYTHTQTYQGEVDGMLTANWSLISEDLSENLAGAVPY